MSEDKFEGTLGTFGSLLHPPPTIYPDLDPQSVEPHIEVGEETDSSHCIRVRGNIATWCITRHLLRKRDNIKGTVEIETMEKPLYTLTMGINTGLGYLPLNLRLGDELLSKFMDEKKLKIEIEVWPMPQEAEDNVQQGDTK